MVAAALALVALWAFAEAVLWFIVADVPIMAVGAIWGRRRAMIAALVGSAAAALGGVALMLWAQGDPAGCRDAMLSVVGVNAQLLDEAGAAWASGGAWAMTVGSFTGVPYKLYAFTAGMDGTGVVAFALLSFLARLPRFVMVALMSGTLAIRLRRRMGNVWFWALFVWTWAGFYSWYWHSMGVF